MADAAHDDQAQPSGTAKGLAEPGFEEPAPDDQDGDGQEAEQRRAGRFLAGALGALSLVGGLTWILLNLHGPDPVVDVGVGAVLAAGGLILLMPHRIALPGKVTWLAATAIGLAGSAAGMLSGAAHVCCMYAFVEQRGFPFRWLSRGGVADDADTAQRLAAADGWHVDIPSLMVNVLVWAYAGIVVVALITGLRRLRARR